MSPVRATMFLTFFHIAVGWVWLLAWVPRRTIGVNFHRLTAAVSVVMLLFAILARYPAADFQALLMSGHTAGNAGPSLREFLAVLATFFSAIAFMNATVFTNRAGLARAFGMLTALCGTAAIVIVAYDMRTALGQATWFPLLALTFLLSAAMNGCVGVGMNLGHWYLMSRLPLEPLQRVSTVLIGVVAAQSVCTLIVLIGGQAPDAHEALMNALKLEVWDGLFVWIRLLVGLIFPLAMAVMIRATARTGSTMSATGLLYISLLPVFAGEAASRYLLLTSGLWL